VLRGLTDAGWVTVADLRTLPGKYRYIAFAAQWDFLDLLAAQAHRYPHFTLRMNADVTGLLRDGEQVTGVRYRAEGAEHTLRAALTVAADGRHSTTCAAAGLKPVDYGAPMDVLWFRLPRADTDPDETFGRTGNGRMLVLINRNDYWQVAYLKWICAR
jgi:2-polyprenyl-6-methoxyphenol hydroxylase-like FAD-dependent oxidoreductase